MVKPCAPIKEEMGRHPTLYQHGVKSQVSVLDKKAVEEKSNEIVAIPELLDKIQIKGQIVTIDAMGTQTAIAEKIKQKTGRLCAGIEEKSKQSV